MRTTTILTLLIAAWCCPAPSAHGQPAAIRGPLAIDDAVDRSAEVPPPMPVTPGPSRRA